MSSKNKENSGNGKKKKTRLRLIFSSKKKDNLDNIHEEHHSVDSSYKMQGNAEEKPVKKTEDVIAENKTDSDTSEESVPLAPTYRPRRRSLSACADVLDTRIKIRGKDEEKSEDEKEETDGDQLSPLPLSPIRSCLRPRSATIGYEGEFVEIDSRPRSVSFSPDTVDPPPRNIKYRAWIEARCKAPPVNVKHEKHKQKMNQLKKVNMSDYLATRKVNSSAGILATSTSAFGGGGMMM